MKLALLAFGLAPAVFPFLDVPFDPTVVTNDYVIRIGGESRESDSSPSGEEWVGESYSILKQGTWTIPNCLETGFMLEVRFDNVPEDLAYLDLEVRFPRMQLPTGGSRDHVKRREPVEVYDGSAYFYYGYYFDHEFERGLGKWEFTLSHQGKEVYYGAFKIVDCDSAKP